LAQVFLNLKWYQMPKFFFSFIIVLLLIGFAFSMSNLFSFEPDFLNFNLMRIFVEPAFVMTIILTVAIGSEYHYFSKNLMDRLYARSTEIKHSESLKEESMNLKESQKLMFEIENSKRFAYFF